MKTQQKLTVRTLLPMVIILLVSSFVTTKAQNSGDEFTTNDKLKYRIVSTTPAQVAVIKNYDHYFVGSVVVPATVEYQGTEYSVVEIGDGGFGNCVSLKSISLPNTIKKIGEYAFIECNNLTSITIPNSVNTIGTRAFHFTGLSSVYIPSSVTTIESSPFSFCIALSSIEVDENNPNYCSVDGVLFNKNKTALIQYPAGKTEVKYYEIPNTVTTVQKEAFLSCPLEAVTIPNSVTNIEEAAFINTKLQSVTLGSSITNIGQYAFRDCWDLTSIYSNINDITNTTTSTDAFYNVNMNHCSLYVLSGNISEYQNLAPWSNFTKIKGTSTSVGDTFEIDSVINSYSIQTIYYTVISSKYKVALMPVCAYASENVIIPKKVKYNDDNYTVTSIQTGTFGEALFNKLSVKLPETLTEIQDQAFNGMVQELSVNIPNSVKTIGCLAFLGIDQLTVFSQKKNVSDIELVNTYDTECRFWESENPSTLIVPKGTKEAYSNAPQWKDFDKIIEDEFVKDGITYRINPIPPYTKVTIVKSNSTPSGLPNYAAIRAEEPTEIVIPSNVEYEGMNFEVTSIGKEAFSSFSNLNSITLPSSITEIETYAFKGCSSLNTLKVKVEDVNNIKMGYRVFLDIDQTACTLEVPQNQISEYQNAEQWEAFNTIEEIQNTPTDIDVISQASISVIGHNIIIKGIKDKRIRLYDISGKTIYNLNTKQSTVSLSVKSAGVYILQVGADSKKVIVQ